MINLFLNFICFFTLEELNELFFKDYFELLLKFIFYDKLKSSGRCIVEIISGHSFLLLIE